MVRQTLCLKMADKYHQHFSGGIVGKWQKFRLFSNNLLRLFENGRKQTINHLVGILLEKGRNFCRFLTTTTSCLKTAEIKPSAILWGLCWKMAEISAVFQQPQPVVWKRQKTNHQQFCGDFVGKRPKFRPFSNNWFSAVFQQPKMFRPFSNKEVSAVFLQFFSAVFHIPVLSIQGRSDLTLISLHYIVTNLSSWEVSKKLPVS